jgi:5,10-methylenetetrahydromethanopterin reductase
MLTTTTDPHNRWTKKRGQVTTRQLLAQHIARYSGSLSTDALAANGLDPEEFARTQSLVLEGRETKAVETVLASSSMLELGIVGGAREVIDQCEALLAAGVRHVSFGPPLGPDAAGAIRLIGERVLPALRRSPAPW